MFYQRANDAMHMHLLMTGGGDVLKKLGEAKDKAGKAMFAAADFTPPPKK